MSTSDTTQTRISGQNIAIVAALLMAVVIVLLLISVYSCTFGKWSIKKSCSKSGFDSSLCSGDPDPAAAAEALGLCSGEADERDVLLLDLLCS